MHLTSDVDNVERSKIDPYRDSDSDPTVIQSLASCYTDCAIPAPTSEAVSDLSLGAHMQFLVGQPFSCMSDYHRII
jgi:hypothetical protein